MSKASNHTARLALAAFLALSSFGVAAQGALSEGEVRKVDKDTGKITLKHGPLTNLDMPAMTMVFLAGDKGMLDQVKVGDKVRFQADKVGGQFTVTRIEPAQ